MPGRNQEVLLTVPKVVCKHYNVLQEGMFELSLTEGGKEGMDKLIASHKYLESGTFGICKDEGLSRYHKSDQEHWKQAEEGSQRVGIIKKTQEF